MDTNDNHMAENNSVPIKHKMGSTILESFTKLVSDNDDERVDAAITLLRHLSQRDSNETDDKELQYALTRLIRGIGSSRIDARKGFFIALTTFLSITSKNRVTKILELLDTELHVVGSNSKSEEAEIYTGQILVCGALIHSKVIHNSPLEEQQKVLVLLLTAGKKRSYLSCASYSFIIDLIDQLEEKDFKTTVWPLLKKEFAKPWVEQTLDTLHAILMVNRKYQTIINGSFLKKYLGSQAIIDESSLTPISSLLMGLPMLLSLRNPVYKIFCEELASTEYVPTFWNIIDQHLATPLRNKMLVAIELATFILSSVKDAAAIPSLITPNFIQSVSRTVVANKRKPDDEVVMKSRKFLDLLVVTMKRDDVQTKTQITLLKKLLLYPGDISIEKHTGTKVIQMITASLSLEGVKKLSKIYTEITAATKPKEKADGSITWTNMERIYAAQMLTRLLGHSAMTAEHEWKLEQLKFLFRMGLCQTRTVGVELAASLKESFYRALDLKLPKLNDLRNILSSLVHYLDSELFVDEKIELRVPLTETGKNTWVEMISLIKKLENNPKVKQAVPIFHTMELHMGLQLFSEPEMAISSIQDLHSCFERIERKKKQESENEPEWVEVVVDLMLSLLSRSSHLLRSLVGCVFPHICPILTESSIHQILDNSIEDLIDESTACWELHNMTKKKNKVLDPKNDKNPLSSRKGGDSSSDEEDEDQDQDQNEEEEEESVEASEEDISDSDPDDNIDEEDETVNDKLRMAVRQALGDAMGQTDDEDIDVDQINEEEGQRLDNALASAFKVLRENRHNKNKKQGKSAQALTHFRVRVVDLLQIYLDSTPSMALVLDILLPLFALLEFSIKDQHQKPLENRIRSCLKRLSTVKKFSSMEGVTGELLTDILKALIDKGSKSAPVYHEMGDKLTECCTFLVRCSQQIEAQENNIDTIYAEILKTFFKKRDCVLPPILFKSVLHLPWAGNWQLAPLLVDFAFDKTIRPFRRNQALEFLDIFYHNRLIQADENHAKTRGLMEKTLSSKSVELLKELGQKKSNEATQGIKQKFVCLLFSLFYTIKHQYQTSSCNWKAIGAEMSLYRLNVSLAKDAKTAYNRLAKKLEIPVHVATTPSQKEESKLENGQHLESNGKGVAETESTNDESDGEVSEVRSKQTKKEKKKKQKNKSKKKDKQQLKREARELRMKAMSDGLDSVDFSMVPVNYINDVDMEIADSEMSQNGGNISSKLNSLNETETQSERRTTPKKRSSSTVSQDLSFKSNKKKK